MSQMQWFRLYSRIVDDEKLRLLAFEDRWHFVALCCLKSDGLLDEPTSDLRQRKIAVKIGVQVRELEEIGRRLQEVGLVDENLSPLAWDELQFRSDNSTDRVKKFREKQRGNAVKRKRNVSVAVQETETETEMKKKGTEIGKGKEIVTKRESVKGTAKEKGTAKGKENANGKEKRREIVNEIGIENASGNVKENENMKEKEKRRETVNENEKEKENEKENEIVI